MVLLALLFYIDLNIGGTVWARACEKLPQDAPGLLSWLADSPAVYTLARAVLMLIFTIAAWNLCKVPMSATGNNPALPLTMLAMCVLGDCVLFQTELYTHFFTPLNPDVRRFEFPATRLQWPVVRREQLPNDSLAKCQSWTNTPETRLFCDIKCVEPDQTSLILKYQAWTNTPGGFYQNFLSSSLQWDPPEPVFRAEWSAKNVSELHEVLGKVSTQDLAVVAGFGGLKFRLVPEASAVRVKTDREAFKLLGSTGGWDRRVILTDPTNDTATHMPTPAASDSRLTLGEFSANSFALSVSNSFTQPAWLI